MPFFGITPKQFSFHAGAYPVTAFFSGFAAAFFVDRHDRKKVPLFAYIGFLIGTLAWRTFIFSIYHSHLLPKERNTRANSMVNNLPVLV